MSYLGNKIKNIIFSSNQEEGEEGDIDDENEVSEIAPIDYS